MTNELIFITKEEIKAQDGCEQMAIGYELAMRDIIDWEDSIITDDKITLLDNEDNPVMVINIERKSEGLSLELVEQKDETINVKQITITRVEGYMEECFTVTANSFEQASNAIKLMAQSAPNDGSYDKSDFKVEWADGQTYEGRLDLQYRMINGYDLRDQMRYVIPRLSETKEQAEQFIELYLTA